MNVDMLEGSETVSLRDVRCCNWCMEKVLSVRVQVATCVLDALALSRKRDGAMTSLLGRASRVGEVRWFVPIFKVKGKQPALCYQHTLPYTLLYACNHITTSHANDIVLLRCKVHDCLASRSIKHTSR